MRYAEESSIVSAPRTHLPMPSELVGWFEVFVADFVFLDSIFTLRGRHAVPHYTSDLSYSRHHGLIMKMRNREDFAISCLSISCLARFSKLF